MKKLICGFLCVAVGVALADVESVVATIEVRAITSSLTNTIVAIPGLDLATGGELAISNMVKTTNLEAGDRLVAFDGERYETWRLSADGGKHWVKPAQKITITPDGTEEPTTTDASQYFLPVGKGIWLSRTASGTNSAFYVYAAHTNEYSTVIAAGTAAALVGNPTTGKMSPTITGCATGDQIVVPSSDTPLRYQYRSTGNWFLGGVHNASTPPEIDAGTGFWYIPKNKQAVTITWP